MVGDDAHKRLLEMGWAWNGSRYWRQLLSAPELELDVCIRPELAFETIERARCGSWVMETVLTGTTIPIGTFIGLIAHYRNFKGAARAALGND